MKERVPIAALIITGAAVLTPVRAGAVNSEVKPVPYSTMSEAIQCVFTGKPGKTILSAENLQGNDGRSIVVLNRGTKYTATYATSQRPYLTVYERQDGTRGQQNLKYFRDGESSPTQASDADNYTDPLQKDIMIALAEIEARKRLDGMVDDATYPEDQASIKKILIKKSDDLPARRLHLEYRFQENIPTYQAGYTNAIYGIVEGCRKN